MQCTDDEGALLCKYCHWHVNDNTILHIIFYDCIIFFILCSKYLLSSVIFFKCRYHAGAGSLFLLMTKESTRAPPAVVHWPNSELQYMYCSYIWNYIKLVLPIKLTEKVMNLFHPLHVFISCFQERKIALHSCLQHNGGWVLADATLCR